jgi:hypothetical protein
LSLVEGSQPGGDEIITNENGRPFFRSGTLDFNISHSGNLAAVSIVKGKNIFTGCDVELIRKKTNAMQIAESFFTAQEVEYILEGNHFIDARFFQIWTLKECFLKLRGLSVFDMPKAPSFITRHGEGPFCFSFGGVACSPLSFFLYELTGPDRHYMLATAIEGAAAVLPEIRWFSHASLAVKSIAEINAALSPPITVSPNI